MITAIFFLICFGLLCGLIFLFIKIHNLSLINKKLTLQITELTEIKKEIQTKIETVLLSFPIPVMVIDKQGIIKFANTEIQNIIGSPPEGHNYIEFFNQTEFIEAIHNIPEGKTLQTELLYKDQFYAVHFVSLTDNEILITLKDITDSKEILRIKKELISNISHELKTPLTVIKGYLETIYEEIPSYLKGQVEIILNHTERLTGIVRDLLKLSELEEIKIEFQKVNIKEVIEKVISMFEKRIIQKNLSLKVNMDTSITYISGDPYKLEDLIINLLDNAIRYTDSGEITIKTEKTDRNLIIGIKDTGIGIPEKDLPRIFERFYVVDKSRSRETGGTGLGLAIVKHIVILHKGTIEIKSSLGEGTEVIISLPLSCNNT
ncbi:MAG: ATP-binding protein [bacterium]|nr:ATP-binding protein [bacterium]